MDQTAHDQRAHIDGCGPGFLRFWENWSALPKTGYVPRLKDYLDNADPRLQPAVVIMDYFPAGHMEVRLAGTGIVDVMGEITHATEKDIYQPSIQQQAFKQGWKALSHPCGFTLRRTFRDSAGRQASASALVLPVETASDRKSVVTYNGFPKFGPETFDDQIIQAIIAFSDLTWVDIGAGVPE